jgi:glycolate oxidase FAD binding subunit
LPSVSEPLSIEEAGELLERAAHAGGRVSIERQGGDLVVSTRYLNRLLEHEAGDLTATVEAGLRLSALNALLAEHGQMLALDPPGDPTIGAAIAGDLFGPRAHRYGRARDLVLGVTLVLGDGTVANSGGKVVKNVAGYDLGKLVCGSHGRLALIARASVRLHSLPAAARTLVVDVEGPADAQGLTWTLLHSPLVPSAVDVLWDGETGALALLFEGSETAAGEQLDRARSLLGGREDDAVWADAAARQLGSGSRRSFARGDLAAVLGELDEGLVRIGPTCFAYLQESGEEEWPPLAERVRAEFDPLGVLV